MDVIVNKKKDQFLEVLRESGLSPIFEFRIAENDVIFRSIQPMKESVPSQILFKLDASIYNDCMVTFGSVENFTSLILMFRIPKSSILNSSLH